MSTATTAPPADVLADLAALDLDPDAVRVEPARSRKAPGSVRVWMGEDLAAATCRDCRALHRAGDLVRYRRQPGGRDLRCLRCAAAAAAAARAEWTEEQRERERERKSRPEYRERERRYREENAEAIRERERRYREENAEAIRERNRRYYEDNAEAERERSRLYREQNLDAARKRDRARSARLAARSDAEILTDREALHPLGVKECGTCHRSLPFEDFSAHRNQPSGLDRRCRPCTAEADRRRLRRRVEVLHPGASRCYICNAGPFDDVEHIVPKSRGGDDSSANLAPSCRDCNRGPDGKHERDPRDFLAERMGLEESWTFLRERLPASLLIGEPLGDFAARQAEASLDLDEDDDEQPAPAPSTSTGRDGFHVLDVEAILGDAHRAA